MSLQEVPVLGSTSGLVNNVKPLFLPEDAYSALFNAYVFRGRTLKRQGLQLLGRLKRNFTAISFFPSQATSPTPWTFNMLFVSGYVAAADNGNPGKITTTYAHNLTTGDTVWISQIVGATGYNQVVWTITVVDAFNFTIGANAGGFGAYVSGGIWQSNHLLHNTSEPEAMVTPGSIVLVIDGQTLTDQGNGLLTGTAGNFGYINYTTGAISLVTTAPLLSAVTLTYSYYPGLPVMGIRTRQLAAINDEQTIFFDTRYAYILVSGAFQEFIPGTSWDGDDSHFFWSANYPAYTGTAATGGRLFFVTNNSYTAGSPMRYTDGSTWTTFAPAVDGTNFLQEAQIIIPYYGRLLALNTGEGTSILTAVNIFNRCRFSAVGNALSADSWRSDIVGKGGFIDAPTNEAIVSAAFVKNTLVVFFEESTWQLRYVGNYGTPFIFERITSDFGSESTFSTIVFDKHALTVGSRAIIAGNGVDVERIDLQIPDQVFEFQNANNGVERVAGARDYQKELVYWCYASAASGLTYPSQVLVYNYRNNTYSIFRDNVTAFGLFQAQSDVNWSSDDITWDMSNIQWNNSIVALIPETASGNQKGYVHLYNQTLPDDQSISIDACTITTDPAGGQTLTLTVNNANILDGDFIKLKNMTFVSSATASATAVSTTLNGQIFLVSKTPASSPTLNLLKWAGPNAPTDYDLNFTFTPDPTAVFVFGEIILLPVMQIMTKDFNPAQQLGKQSFISRCDVLLGTTPGAVSVQLFADSAINEQTNLITGNQELETYPYTQGIISTATNANPCVITSPGYFLQTGDQIKIENVIGMTQLNNNNYTVTCIDTETFSINVDSTGFGTYVSNGSWTKNSPTFFNVASDYLWHSFYATLAAQYIRVGFTYDDVLMNNPVTHTSDFELHGINLWMRKAGKMVF